MNYNDIFEDILAERRLEIIIRFNDDFMNSLQSIVILKYDSNLSGRRFSESISYQIYNQLFTSSKSSLISIHSSFESSNLTTWGFIDVPLDFYEILYLREMFDLLSSRINTV